MFWTKPPTRLIALLALALLAGVGQATGAADRTAAGADDLTLHGPDGPISLSALRGKVVVIFFGYTGCPDVCPVSLARMSASLSAMEEAERDHVRALFITLDPERDTAERLAQYTNYFNASIIGVRADREAIDAVTDKYGVKYAREQLPDSALGYSIAHSTDILLLDTAGRLVERIPHDSQPAYLLARIRDLLHAAD